MVPPSEKYNLPSLIADVGATNARLALVGGSGVERVQVLACEDRTERIVATRAGEAEWAEPEGYCDRCRRSFFPSVEKPGP